MEPITHFLTGACISRAGLNRKTAYATLAAVVAAEAADIDILWSFAGPVEELKHHRGITHTFLAAPLVAAAVVGAVWLLDRAVRALRKPRDNAAYPNYGWLYLTAFVAALSHLLLDWTNNYGLRPFFPFNPRWYEGSIVFIAEPVLWALLLLALVIPALLDLVSGEIGARKPKFRGQEWAIFALSGMILLWAWRWTEQAHARLLLGNIALTSAPVKRIALEPYPINPFRWHAIIETADFYQTAEINTLSGEIESDPGQVIFKPKATAATEAAKQTSLGRVYLDWGSWAVVRDLGPVPVPGLAPPELSPQRQWTTVQFTDLRYSYSYLGAISRANSGASRGANGSLLGGFVYIVDNRDDAGEVMNGRKQR
jgi:inner membrane protein